jgi:hypothetical protein
MKKHILFGVFCLTALATSAQDAMMKTDTMMLPDPIQADRPDLTESAFLVPKGYFQMEHGLSIEDTDPGYVYAYPSSLWKYGINDNFELRLTTEYLHIDRAGDDLDVKGFSPFSLGLKARLGEQRGVLPKTAFIGHLYFPTIGNEAFDITYFAPTMRLAFYNAIGSMFSVSYNVGAEWTGESAEPNFIYSLAAGLAISDRLSVYGEVYGSTPQREDDTMELRADAGLTYLLSNNFLLDFSAGQGITDNAPERYVAFGFSYRFPL